MVRLYTRPFVLCALANFAQAVSFRLFLHFPGFLKELGAGGLAGATLLFLLWDRRNGKQKPRF